MKDMLKKIRVLEAEMEKVENWSEYWLQDEYLDIDKSDRYQAEADRLYQEVYKMHNQTADYIVNITSGQIDKITAMRIIRHKREDLERILAHPITTAITA